MTPSQLDALALKLKLSKRQRLFCAALAQSDRERGSQVAAMREAGYKGGDGTLYVGGSKLVRRPKVQAYLRALAETSASSIEIRKRERGGIKTLGESLALMTDMAEGRIATETRVYHDRENGTMVKRAVNRFARRDAAESLIRYHVGDYARENAPPKPPQPINVVVNVAVLSMDELVALREMRKKVLNGRASGNGDGETA